MSKAREGRLSRTDTGLKYSSTGEDYCIDDLDRKRDAVLDDFPSIPEIDVTTFTQSFLPPLPSGVDEDEIFLSLLELKIIRRRNQGSFYWDAFATEPANSTVAEGATFDNLIGVYNSVIETAHLSGVMPTVKLYLNLDNAPFPIRTHNIRPNGYMILTQNCTGSDRWEDLAVTMEFEKNMKKQIFSMQQLMTYDPCRRFTFGLTIENTNVRLWFCSRSMLAVSEHFDLNQEPTYLIHAYLSFTYASKADLGWDETMTPMIVGKETQYEIKIDHNTYETQGKPLSDFVAHSAFYYWTCDSSLQSEEKIARSDRTNICSERCLAH